MRLAFIGGCGHHYLWACLSDPACDITRLVPVAGDGCDDERARAFAAALPGETQWFDSAAEMLDTARPDVVSVGAVYARNAEFNVAALQRGISVVSDKPIAATWDDLFRIETVTHGTNRVLLTEFDFRARPEFRAMRAAVADGRIGTVVLATAQKSYKFGTRPG